MVHNFPFLFQGWWKQADIRAIKSSSVRIQHTNLHQHTRSRNCLQTRSCAILYLARNHKIIYSQQCVICLDPTLKIWPVLIIFEDNTIPRNILPKRGVKIIGRTEHTEQTYHYSTLRPRATVRFLNNLFNHLINILL